MIISTSQDGAYAVVLQVATRRPMTVFQARTDRQSRAGFEAEQWYYAPLGGLGMTPQSAPYATREAAIVAVNTPGGQFAAV